MNTQEKDSWNKLSLLGIVQLVAFAVIAVSLFYQPSLGSVGYLGSMDEYFMQPYLYAGLLLMPSAVIFTLAPRQTNVSLIRVARIIQQILFVVVCLASVPSAFLAQSRPQLLIACILGMAFFPFMMILVRKALGVTVADSTREQK